MKKLIASVLILVCVLGLVGCDNNTEIAPESRENNREVIMESDIEECCGPILDYENNEISSARGWFGDFPNGLRPMMMVNGKLYRCTGKSLKLSIQDSKVYLTGAARNILPDGYTAIGEISGITEEVPSEELQLRAAFEASGTVFTNDQTPEAIYVQMTALSYTDDYIRFVSDDLHDNECISYHGKLYRFLPDYDICELIKELPENCVQIGTLKYIGDDTIPRNDLETNRISDSYSYLIDGREVYADPDDDSLLYVYEHHYWAEGDYPAWRVCKLWSEFEN